MKWFASSFRAALTLILTMTVILGGVYPLLVTVFAQTLFNHRANGSLIERADKVYGSSLLGQNFSDPKYFWGRLSATSFNAASSGGSNFSPANPKILEQANGRISDLQKADPTNKMLVPVELVSASASGLDPHISSLAARYQVQRVARLRKLTEEQVHALITKYEKGTSGLFGEPYINVMRLNMALDELADAAPAKPGTAKK